MEKTLTKQVTIAGKPFALRQADVLRALRRTEPEAILSHFVVVGDRRFPPKQVISVVTGLDRADFTTHQARRTLMRLGFSAGRRVNSALWRPQEQPSDGSRLGTRLRPLQGRWVAIKDGDVLHDAETAAELVSWLTRQGQKADSTFRVPEDERAATGFAPL